MSSLISSGELEKQKRFIRIQTLSIAILCIAALGVWIGTSIFPNFFNYPYLDWGGWDSVVRFWPVFLWGATMATLSGLQGVPVHVSERSSLFRYGLVTSILAGVWEEIAYRWIFIFYALIILAALNWAFGAGLGWVAVAAAVGAFLFLAYEQEWVGAVLCLVGAVLAMVFAEHVNPIYWFYHLLVWIIHYTTFFQMDSILYGEHEQLFLFGAVLANTWFRDGHKYQGTVGLINSWYMGMVLLYATMTYGLATAIVIHALYDIEFDIMHYLLRKTKR